ncbi:glycosyltransferase family 2 protein, partial [Comamonas thiooxydans]|uniref:glycosyltransferase family 2 protein n=1 Tax=Comamonas thiooxydans TaxID=363952 RepID=UPI0015546FBB
MQKNEVHLLPTWIKYHAEIFGFENIYIFDNGSDIELKDQLKIYSEFGLNVNLNFTGVNNFENKGKIFGNLIKSLEAEKKYDFFIPLDCDEFIAVEKSDGLISCERDDIFLELAKHSESKDILMIGYQLYNDVSKDSKFYKEFSRKCFFYKETFLSVDVGFHWAKVKKSSKEIKTNIIQFHFHNRPYFLSKKSALQKMAKRVDINNNILLRDYDGPGFHLKNFFIMNEEVWKKSIEKENFVDSDVLSKKLSNLKLIWPFSDFVFFEREIFFFDYKKEAVVSFEKCDDRQHSNGWVDGVHISEGSAFFNGWWVSDKNKNTL